MESSKKASNKIAEIVKLQQVLKKWKKLAVTPKAGAAAGSGGINKFLKRTLSFSENPAAASGEAAVPKGYLAVSVGEEMRRFVIPTEYLGHRAFAALLQEAEEEFGFGQEGVLRIPCEVAAFESVLKVVEKRKEGSLCYCSAEADDMAGSSGHGGSQPNSACR
ncbi:auxin-induced protein 10A5-like [Curcuma longa]|uniref:auxin-induced protein 10A5-like n=1 Tax=Curcuma longa TaxID=136217 RepID=UPI003D9F15A1